MNQDTVENENRNIENPESRPEARLEAREEQEDGFIRGAEMLEEPPDGSFTQGLQAFVAWVKSLVAPNNKL